MKEIFEEFPLEPRYLIGNCGTVISTFKNKSTYLKEYTDNNGYKRLTLNINGRPKKFLIHRLVMLTFTPNDLSDTLVVNHIDCDPSNNSMNNLEWCTQRQNMDHAKENNRMAAQWGEASGVSKFKNFEVLDIIEGLSDGFSGSEIARYYKVSPSTISAIIKGRNWSEVTGIKRS